MIWLKIFLWGLVVLILIINFFINFANIIRIVAFCFLTKSIDDYWPLFFKSCVSHRAIISSMIGFFVGLVVFVIIAPIILLKSLTGKNKTSEVSNDENKHIEFKSNSNSGFVSKNTIKKGGLEEFERLKKQTLEEDERERKRKEKEDPSRFMPK